MALPVDRAQSNAMNLQVLKRQDESVMDIVDMASHVVVYEFDQGPAQCWKRKDVEGCLFVVKRYASPRFQIFVNNRLSTTNMTIPVNSSLEVDSVDTFMILRSPDASAVGGFAIYGLWFYPEEDKEKILTLLQRMVRTVNEPSAPPTPTTQKTTKPKQVEVEEQPEQPQSPKPQQDEQQQQQQQPKSQRQPRQRSQNGRGGRGRNKRDNSNSKPGTPTAILQRSQGDATTEPSAEPVAPVPVASGNGSGYTPISREEGIAAGNAILGMLSGNSQPSVTSASGPVLAPPSYVNAAASTTVAVAPAQPQPRSRASSSQNTAGQSNAVVSKEQLKQTLIALLDEPQFFDQIYHAYVNRVPARS